MSTSPLTFRLARPDEGPAVAAFLDAHWGEKHPLVHLPDFFDFYYRPFGPDGPLQFAFAEQDGAPSPLWDISAPTRWKRPTSGCPSGVPSKGTTAADWN